MRESRSYGSVGEQGGNELLYPDERKKMSGVEDEEWELTGR
jgi:hypothetical protein